VETRVTGALLWSRALAVGLLAVLLGAAGHASAGGLLPGVPVVAAMVVVGAVLAAPAVARRVSALRCAGLLVVGQAGVHVGLTVTAGHVGDTGPGAGPVSGHVGAAVTTGAPVLPEVDGRRVGSLLEAYDVGTGLGAATVPGLGDLTAHLLAHGPMMLAHVLVAALVGLWLACGERAAWDLVALTARRALLVLAAVGVAVVLPRDPRPLRTSLPRLPLLPQWRTTPHLRRGPPLLLG